jgi:hypothetical protein
MWNTVRVKQPIQLILINPYVLIYIYTTDFPLHNFWNLPFLPPQSYETAPASRVMIVFNFLSVKLCRFLHSFPLFT